jgi:hypothetical protein
MIEGPLSSSFREIYQADARLLGWLRRVAGKFPVQITRGAAVKSWERVEGDTLAGLADPAI